MLKKCLYIFFTASLIWGCKEKNKTNEDDYDVSKILANITTEIVIPKYDSLTIATGALKSQANLFITTPNSNNLLALQNSFKAAYKSWQKASVSNFGYASDAALSLTLNTFPTDTIEINSLLKASNPNYSKASYINATGFPGLDYVLFYGEENKILDRFTNANYGQGAKNYLMGVINIIDEAANKAEDFWKNNENSFKSNFITDKNKSAGSGFSVFTNGYIQNVEVLKNAQMGIPSGDLNLGITRPDQTEAYFSNYSKDLYIAHLEALKNMYLGIDANGNNGESLDDYIQYLNVKRNGENLHELITSAFDSLEIKINQVSGSVKDGVENQTSLMNEIFFENKKLVAYLKVDMMNAFNVQITYNSGDGD